MVSEGQSAPDTNVPSVTPAENVPSVTQAEREPARSLPSKRNWQIPVVLVVAPLLLLVVYFKVVYAGLISTDALDFAQLGRNISAGHGMSTYVLHPLALTHGANLSRQPDVTHGPLFPLLLAFAFGAKGAHDAVASCVSGLFYVLTIPLLYVLGLRVFNRTVGLIAAAAFACSDITLQYAVSGLHITLYTFLVTALFLALYNLGLSRSGQAAATDAPPSTKLLALIGMLTGLLYLTDPIFVWLIPIVFGSVLQICGPQRRMAVLKFLLPCGLLVLPWMGRNFLVTGNPIFGMRGAELWMFTPHHFPGRTGYALYSDDFARGPYLLPAVFRKLAVGLNTIVHALPQIFDVWILAFLMPCLFFGYSSRPAMMLRRTLVFSALALLMGMLLFQVEMPLFSSLVPTMLAFSIAYLTHLVRQAKLTSASAWMLSALLGMTVLYPLVSQMTLDEKVYSLPEMAAAQAMNKMVSPEEAILSDHPEAVAWYADRPAIQIPAADERITDIRKQFPTMRWMLLTPLSRSQSAPWKAIYDEYARWNIGYVQAQVGKAEVPTVLRISATNQPLYRALTGFTSVAPVQNVSPLMVIAVLPTTKLSMGTEPNSRRTP